MRMVLVFTLALMGSGCVHLDAKPMNFACRPLLDGNVDTYQPSALFAQIQRDAGYDDRAGESLTSPQGVAVDNISPNDLLISALNSKAELNRIGARSPKVLLLSGGGSWGAFGAGFLRKRNVRDWDAVTGISTGSLQGLFVAAGDYDRMVGEYAISEEAEVATANSIPGILRKGSQYDIAPLRMRVFEYLLNSPSGELPFERMARPNAPALFVGMVEASSGNLKVVAISAIVRKSFARGKPDAAKLGALADCIAGVTLASSSIPVRLTPVRIDGKAYFDGGVRSSVFEAGVALRLASGAKSGNPYVAPDLYVVRNGPTVVFGDDVDPATGRPNVDVRPDVGRIAMRGYSTIVNQSELMSIAGLRLSYPQGSIKVITADGFNHPRDPGACGPRPRAVFDPTFMRCLIGWGERKASRCKWIDLDLTLSVSPDHRRPEEEPCNAFDQL